jgi:hypothetical protein
MDDQFLCDATLWLTVGGTAGLCTVPRLITNHLIVESSDSKSLLPNRPSHCPLEVLIPMMGQVQKLARGTSLAALCCDQRFWMRRSNFRLVSIPPAVSIPSHLEIVLIKL